MLTNHRMSQLVSILERCSKRQATFCLKSYLPGADYFMKSAHSAPPYPALLSSALPCFFSGSGSPETFSWSHSVVSSIKRTLCWSQGKSLRTSSKLQILNTSNTHVNYVWNNKPFEPFTLGCMGCAYIEEHKQLKTGKPSHLQCAFVKWHTDTIPNVMWICR